MNENLPDRISSTFPELGRVDVLIIAVGTGQIGWRCRDGIVRRFQTASSGTESALLRELELESSNLPQNLPELSQYCEDYCRNRLAGDFGAIELLLDESIVRDSARGGLQRLILWGTERPSNVPGSDRNTIGLARLMVGKIRGDFPDLEVNVVGLSAAADDETGIRQELEAKVLPLALPASKASLPPEGTVFAIQSRGSEPAIDRECIRCVAALSRHGGAIDFTPLFPPDDRIPSTAYQVHRIGGYGWFWERSQIVKAWKRGDFPTARSSLSAHPQRDGELLASLAGQLEQWKTGNIRSLLLNAEASSLVRWLNSPILSERVTLDRVQHWQQKLNELREHPEAQAWEATFLMDLHLKNGDFPEAFLQFARILERLLYLQYEAHNWLGRGYVVMPNYLNHLGKSYQPGLKRLVNAWLKMTGRSQKGAINQLFDNICNTRSIIFQKTEKMPLDEILFVWSKNGWPIEFTRPQYLGLMQRMHEALKMVCDPAWNISEPTLGRSLYEWGLNVIQQDAGRG
ncbi:MAG: hypothetical protein SWY16_19275 [Cyanobacteriota bacterium]|nr:hypothetical protein [Cyanobacteriota bacterium]